MQAKIWTANPTHEGAGHSAHSGRNAHAPALGTAATGSSMGAE